MSTIQFDDSQSLNGDLVTLQQQQALKRYLERSSERERIADNLQTKNPLEVDTAERVANRMKIINPRDGLAFERLIGNNDLFPISFFEAGLKAAKPICRIEVRDKIGRFLGHGTGFLVSSSLLLTNNHVLENEESALFSVAQFNYELNLDKKERPIISFQLKPQDFFITNKELDFTLVAIEEITADGTKSDDFGFLQLLPQKGKVLVGEYVSIIQHPSGAPKAVAVRENKITDIFDDYIHYSTDTFNGSSGAPVFNDEWMVVALHHAGVPDPNDNNKYISNEGIRISSILKFIMEQSSNLSDNKKKLIDGIVNNWGDINWNSEELQEGSTGYNTKFLGNNYEIPHPKFRSDLKQDIVTLNNDDTVLNYTNFSIVMSKSRRLAYYTVVNIDGNQLVSIDRENKWHLDTRIEKNYQCGPELYDDNDFDKGHLVRRKDPIWGDRASEANKDTFYYTNCSPQHKDFNQKTWLDLEDYILNNAENFNLKVTVFTGPVFRADDILYRNVQIPAEFWKVAVIVKKNGELSATAYLQTQKGLIKDLEFEYGEYKTYQVRVATIENLTGLDFGNLRNYDPKERFEINEVGHIINNSEDIVF